MLPFNKPNPKGLFQPPLKSHPVKLQPMWDNEIKNFEEKKDLYTPDEFKTELMKKGGKIKHKFQAN